MQAINEIGTMSEHISNHRLVESQLEKMWDEIWLWLNVKFSGHLSPQDVDSRQLSLLYAAMQMEKDCDLCSNPADCPHSRAYIDVRETVKRGYKELEIGAVLCQKARVSAETNKQVDLFRLSRIPSLRREETLENFICGDSTELRLAKLAAIEVANNGSSLLLGGSIGSGKTHLAIGIGLKRMSVGKSVLFYLVSELIEALKPNNPCSEDVMKRAQESDTLILDDAGMQRDTLWSDAQLFMVIDHRYSHKKQMIITTNAIGWDQFKKTLGSNGAQIVSRIKEVADEVWLTETDDFRTKKTTEQRSLM